MMLVQPFPRMRMLDFSTISICKKKEHIVSPTEKVKLHTMEMQNLWMIKHSLDSLISKEKVLSYSPVGLSDKSWF